MKSKKESDPLLPTSTSDEVLTSSISYQLKRNIKKDSPHSNKTITIFCLCCTFLTLSYLIINVTPYAGFLAVKLIDDLNEENTGYYAGFISASFQAGRMMTSIFWGKFSDKYGRVKTMQISLFLSAVFSLCFAFAPTFFTCVLFRGLIGASCGLVSSIFTYLSEFPQGDNKLESSMTAIVLGMWGYGFLIGPTLSGFLSDPF